MTLTKLEKLLIILLVVLAVVVLLLMLKGDKDFEKEPSETEKRLLERNTQIDSKVDQLLIYREQDKDSIKVLKEALQGLSAKKTYITNHFYNEATTINSLTDSLQYVRLFDYSLPYLDSLDRLGLLDRAAVPE